MVELAIATHTPLGWWLTAGDEWVATAIDVLTESAESAEGE